MTHNLFCKHYCYDRLEIVKAVVGRSHKVIYKPQHYFKCKKGHNLKTDCNDCCKDYEEEKLEGE